MFAGLCWSDERSFACPCFIMASCSWWFPLGRACVVCCRTSWSLMCAGCLPAEQSVGLCLDFIVCVIFTVRPSKRGTKRQWE